MSQEAMAIVDKHRLPQQQQMRVRELLFRNCEGMLTQIEEQELDAYMTTLDKALEDTADELLRFAKDRQHSAV